MTLGSIKILLVESEVGEQLRIERFLRGYGATYRLHAVATTQAALVCLKESHYDVVVVDYRFSDGTVWDLLEEGTDAPVILLVDEGQESLAAMALKRGAYDYLIRDPDYNFLVLLPATVQKVINRKRVEDALRDTERRCKDLLDLVLDIYLCVSEEGQILLVNQAGARRLGYTPKELVGQPFERLVVREDLEPLKVAVSEAVAMPDQPVSTTFRFLTRNGQMILAKAQIRAQPERGRQIPVIRFVCKPISVVNGIPLGNANGQTVVSAGMEETIPIMSVSPSLHERVLVVGTDREQRALTARLLAQNGFRVVTAESETAALALIKAGSDPTAPTKPPFDVVVLDELGSGSPQRIIETCQSICELFPCERFVLLSSGTCDEKVVAWARENGVPLVFKPFSVEALVTAVKRALQDTAKDSPMPSETDTTGH